jgi:prepilin-type N-terminal cleavage/methylation domain-containing protein
MRPRPHCVHRGFTIIEILMVVVVLGVLTAIAIPNFHKVVYKARASDILSDVHIIQVAYSQYLADGNTRPRNSRWGQVSRDLVPYLPDGFSFATDDADYRWLRVRGRASPWGTECGEVRVRPKSRWRQLLLDNLEAMSNRSTTLRKPNHIRFYMVP